MGEKKKRDGGAQYSHLGEKGRDKKGPAEET